MKHRTLALSLAACLFVAAPLTAQTTSRASLVAQLSSADPAARSAAFDRLSRIPGVWSEPSMQTKLVDLLEREDQLLDGGDVSNLGESYAEYSALVLDTCVKYCDRRSARVNRAIADAAYSAFSDFAKQLAAEHGAEILPTVMANARSRFGSTNYQSIVMIANIARSAKALSAEQEAEIDSVAVAAAADPRSFLQREAGIGVVSAILESGRSLTAMLRARFHEIVRDRATDVYPRVRVAAAKALGLFADPSDLDLLSRLAESDTARVVNRSVTVYPVRIEAARARARIKPK